MALEIVTLVLGPLENNTYLVADPSTKEAVVIDPSFESGIILQAIQSHGWQLKQIWLTHAHFDHISGTGDIVKAYPGGIPSALHPADMPLWREGGGGKMFDMPMDAGPEPTIQLAHNMTVKVGTEPFIVLHAPGHTPGHVLFYSQAHKVMFCGDVIFMGSIGRTDLAEGDFGALFSSIEQNILPLPDDVRLLCGHGPETTLGDEKANNPFLQG